MPKLERIKQDDRLLRALTGLNLKAFEELKPVGMTRDTKGLISRETLEDVTPGLIDVVERAIAH